MRSVVVACGNAYRSFWSQELSYTGDAAAGTGARAIVGTGTGVG